MKNTKTLMALLLSIIMMFSLLPVNAAATDITIVKELDPATLDWNAANVANIDFSTLNLENPYATSVQNGSIAGNGLSIMTNIDNNSQRAANRFSGGYMLLGKAARFNTLTGTGVNQGRIYVKLDEPKASKANKPYAVKVEYLAKVERTAADPNQNIADDTNSFSSTSWISIVYNNTSALNTKETSQNKLGATYNSGEVKTMYFLLPDANLAENVSDQMSNNVADFKLNTDTGNTQLKIKSISVVAYEPFAVPTMKEVIKGNNETVSSIDFSELNIADPYDSSVQNGSVAGNGLMIMTNVAEGAQRAANRFSDGYMLLGKAARFNTLTGTGVNQGRIYVKLNETKENKANRPYAVKVEYLAKAERTVADPNQNILDDTNAMASTSWISIVYNNTSAVNTKETTHNTLGTTFNSGEVKTMYFLLPDANFAENVSDQVGDKTADFKLNTDAGTTQLKIKSISVVAYDAAQQITDPSMLFSRYSEGAIAADTVLVNANTGEYAGLRYATDAPVVKLIDLEENDHFVVQPVYDANNLGTLGFKISDTYVKAAKQAVITVSYWDNGTGTFLIEYNSVTPYQATASVTLEDTKQLKTASFTVNKTAFTGAQVGGYDFKLLTYQSDFCVEKVTVTDIATVGDVDRNHELNAADVIALRKHLLGIKTYENTDVNQDGNTDILDLIKLKKLLTEV